MIRKLWRFLFWHCPTFYSWPKGHFMASEDACYCCGLSKLMHPVRHGGGWWYWELVGGDPEQRTGDGMNETQVGDMLEFEITTQHPLPVHELVQIDDDSRLYRVMRTEGTTSLIRMISNARDDQRRRLVKTQRTGDEPV